MESLAPVTPQGQAITTLFHVALAVSAVILLLVYGVLFVILRRDRGRPGDPEPAQVEGHVRLEALWTATPAVILAAMFVFAVGTMRTVYPAAPPAAALRVQVTGHQWWWEFVYPELGVVTANELHVPVGVPVVLELTSADVIHSFWVPQLGWKRDAIPGKTNTITVTVQEPGTYDGACTEFCGVQHAWMRIRLVAEPQTQFQSWVQDQRQPAPAAPLPPTPTAGSAPAAPLPLTPTSTVTGTSLVTRGQQVFLANTCINCHRVAGTPANSQVGPDLTHLASRTTIGAGVAPNTPRNLLRWVQNARAVKPGVLMPPFAALSDDDLNAVVAYLSSLE